MSLIAKSLYSCAVLAFMSALVPGTRAVTTNWNTNSSGNYNASGNWDNGAPDGDDWAVFNRGVGVGYTVTFPGAPTGNPPPVYSAQLLDVESNDVTFQRGNIIIGPVSGSLQTSAMFVGYNMGAVTTFTTTLPISAGAVDIAGSSAIVGVHINASTWTLTGGGFALTVGDLGFATMSINNGAQVRLTGGDPDVVLGSSAGATGALLVSGSTSEMRFDNDGSLIVGQNGAGQLTLTNGGKVYGIGDTDGYVRSGSTASVDGSGSIWAADAIDVHGSLSVFSSGVVSADTVSIHAGGTLNGNGTIIGNLESGQLGIAAASVVAPGFSIGALHVTGNFSQGPLGHLQIEIGGTTAGTQYDQLLVTGGDTLGGALDVSFVNGFTPLRGDTFNILNFSAISGTFATLNLPTVPAFLGWDTSELYTAGVLSVQLLGDFNHDGTVDAADYVKWRKGLGTTYTQTDYSTWRANFGRTASGSGSGFAGAAVPEPSYILLLTVSAIGWGRSIKSRRSKP